MNRTDEIRNKNLLRDLSIKNNSLKRSNETKLRTICYFTFFMLRLCCLLSCPSMCIFLEMTGPYRANSTVSVTPM